MKIASWVALAALCTATAAAAQEGAVADRGSTRGLGVGVNLGQTRVGPGAPALNGGGGVTASYGIGERLNVFARAGGGYRSSHLDAGVRYSFGGPGRALRPYVELAATRVGFSDTRGAFARQDEMDPVDGGIPRFRGFGVTGGAGVEYFVGRGLSLDVGVLRTRGRFDRLELNGTRSDPSRRFGSTRVNVGFRWRP